MYFSKAPLRSDIPEKWSRSAENKAVNFHRTKREGLKLNKLFFSGVTEALFITAERPTYVCEVDKASASLTFYRDTQQITSYLDSRLPGRSLRRKVPRLSRDAFEVGYIWRIHRIKINWIPSVDARPVGQIFGLVSRIGITDRNFSLLRREISHIWLVHLLTRIIVTKLLMERGRCCKLRLNPVSFVDSRGKDHRSPKTENNNNNEK